MNNIFLGALLLMLGVIALYQHRLAVSLVVASIPLYLVRGSIFGIPTNFFELSLLLVAVVAVGQPSWRVAAITAAQRLPRVIWWGISGWFIAAVTAVIISPELVVSLGILKSWIIAPLLLAGLVYVAGPRARRPVITALIFSGVITALFSLLYYSSGVRLAGIYDVPNSLALWLVPLIVLALWCATSVSWLAAAIMTVALLATQSVAGLISLVVTIIVGAAIFLAGRQRTRALLGATLLLLVIGMALTVSGRVNYLLLPWTHGQANSLSVRAQLWRVSLDLITDHPLLGVGLGQFEGAYQAQLHEYFAIAAQNNTRAPLPEFVFRDPHNWLLSLWLNTGLLGVISFISVHVYLFWRTWQRGGMHPETQGTLLALAALLIFGLVDTIYWKNDLAAAQWILLALIMSFIVQTEDLEHPTRTEG